MWAVFYVNSDGTKGRFKEGPYRKKSEALEWKIKEMARTGQTLMVGKL